MQTSKTSLSEILTNRDNFNRDYKSVIEKLFQFYNPKEKLNKKDLEMNAEVLSNWPLEVVEYAAQARMCEPMYTTFPVPIHALLANSPEEKQDEKKIREAVTEIILAIPMFGWANGEKAMAHLGELARETVARSGGWHKVCESSAQDPQIYKGELRESAKFALKAKRGNVLPLSQ
jgi:hypothetical protein